MWLIKVFCVISFTVLCATQNPDEDVVSTTPTILPAPTELPMWSVTPTLSVDPPAAQIYAGESVSLSCSTTDSPPDWTYLFFHNDQDKPLQSSNPSYTSYNINSSKLTDRGTYWCQVKRRQEPSAFSNSISLVVNDPPTPSLQLESGWLDVFPTENVEFRCSIPGGSEWTFSWYREGQEVLEKDSNMVFAAERSVLTVTAASQLYAGNYVCKGRHKSKAITTGNSNPLLLSVYAHKPKPSVIQTPKFDKMYTGESVSLSCRVSMSTGWQYVWYQNNKELQTTDKYTLNSPNQSNSGQYMCQAKRGKTPFYSDESETVTLHFSDPPKPSLKLVTRWLDVFESEEMEMSCEMNGSDWTFTWYKNGKILHEDFNTLFEGSSLFIMSATQAVQGIYSCKAHHSTRKVSSELSNTANITVYEPSKMTGRTKRLHRD
ncbi:hypothetical protein LDENG_00047020 [Lucifuga dentata]|nr:hypothetical protein LDENG_00047020 [Lucifuga dentata]